MTSGRPSTPSLEGSAGNGPRIRSLSQRGLWSWDSDSQAGAVRTSWGVMSTGLTAQLTPRLAAATQLNYSEPGVLVLGLRPHCGPGTNALAFLKHCPQIRPPGVPAVISRSKGYLKGT